MSYVSSSCSDVAEVERLIRAAERRRLDQLAGMCVVLRFVFLVVVWRVEWDAVDQFEASQQDLDHVSCRDIGGSSEQRSKQRSVTTPSEMFTEAELGKRGGTRSGPSTDRIEVAATTPSSSTTPSHDSIASATTYPAN